MASLTWKVKKIEDSCGNSNPSWISVSPSTGTSSVSPNITVSEATSPDDCSDGYVVLSASTGDETIIPVSRCLPDCNCIKAAFASTIDGTEYGENYEGTVTAGTYSTSACGTIGVIVGGTIFDRSSVSVSGGEITIKVTANTSYDKRYDFFRFTLNGKTCFSGSISQAAKVNPCYTSTTVSVTPTTITDETCTGTSVTYSLTGTGNECWFVKKAKITPNDLAIINFDSSEITVTPNPSYESRTGECLLTIQNATNGIEVQSTINITQAGCEAPATCTDIEWINTSTTCTTCDCNENDFTLNSSSLPIPSGGYNDIIGTVEGCIDKETMELRDNTWGSVTKPDVILQYSDDNNIYLIVSANTGDTREETVNIAYFDRCGKELGSSALTLAQEAASSCADLDITASSVSFNSSGGSINVGTISGSHTVTKTSDSPSWATVNTSSGNISVSASTTTESRSGTVTFKVDDDICSGKEVTVSQTVPASVIKYTATTKVNVNLNNFTPAATAETFSNGVGKVEFAETVTAIGEKAFSGKSAMTGIDIPDTITSIGHSAFTNCYGLSSITIPSSVGSINNYLLYNCTSLSSVTLESETLQLKPYSISNCPNLRKIEMTSVTACPSDYQNALENSADCPIYVPEEHLSDFWNSSTFQYKDRVIAHVGNQSIVYKAPQKLTGDSLGNAYSSEYKIYSAKLSILLHTFNSSTKIGKITYDGVVRSFHDGAFDTRAIDYIVLPENIKRIGQTVFESSNLISIYFPDSVVGLCNSATDWGCDILHNCTKLKTVVAGSGLTQIGYSCFSCADEASSLTGITFYSTTPPTLDHGNTFGHTIHASIYVPCGQVSTYKSANIWNESDIKGKIKAIPPCAS